MLKKKVFCAFFLYFLHTNETTIPGMSYLVQLVIKFPTDWHLHIKSLIFSRYSQKKNIKNEKFEKKN